MGLDEEEQKILTDTAVGQKLSVRELERLVQQNRKAVTKSDRDKLPSQRLQSVVQKLKTHGFTAKIVKNGLQISFENEEEMKRFGEFFS